MRNALPLVINNVPGRFKQLTLGASVGNNGTNRPDDVRTVQTLLNALTTTEGRPSAPLSVDGRVGPMTVAAIRRFQAAQRLAVVDGLVEPNRNTVRALGNVLNSRNALPAGLPAVTDPDPAFVSALRGNAPVPPGRPVTDRATAAAAPSMAPGQPTGWTLDSTGGFDLSVGLLAVMHTFLYLSHDTEPGKRYKLSYEGIGAGLSVLPVGFDTWFRDMKSRSSAVRYGRPAATLGLGRARPFGADAFTGLPTSVMSVGAGLGPGLSGAMFMFGSVAPAVEPIYFAWSAGMQAGLPNVGFTMYVGKVSE